MQDALQNQAEPTTLDLTEVRGSTQSPDYFPADDWFPDIRGMSEMDARQYVEARMIELAKQDKLTVTGLHNQRPRATRLAGQIILGQRIELESHMLVTEAGAVPFELTSYTVKVKGIGNNKIGWKKGMAPRRFTQNRAGRVHLYEEVRMQSSVSEAVLPLQQAWMILHQAGKYCLRAKTTTSKALFWKFEEVPREQWSPPSMTEPESGAAPQSTGRRGR